MNKKWITIPLALLSILSVGAPTLSASARRRSYRTRVHRYRESNNQYVAKRVTFYRHGQIFRVHGRVTPIQIATYYKTHYLTVPVAFENATGRVMDTYSLSSRPVWHYYTIQRSDKHARDRDVSTGKYHKENSMQNWLRPDYHDPVHMRTPMHYGYYYQTNYTDTSSLQFIYHHTIVGTSKHSFAFMLPNHPNSHYHGTEYQLIANLRHNKGVAPKGYVLINRHHNTYTVIMKRFKYSSSFPMPTAYVYKASAPIAIDYNENGRLVSAGAKLKNISSHRQLLARLKGLKLRKPTKGFRAKPLRYATLRISPRGNEYVNLPTTGVAFKKTIKPTAFNKLHWVKSVHQCQLYSGLSTNGILKHPVKTIHPGHNDTFHLSKIVIIHAKNGNIFHRYQIKYNGKIYYSTARPYYMGNAYYQPSEIGHAHKIKVILPVGEYKSHVYKKDTLIRYVHKGNVLNIKRIMPIGEDFQYRFILNNGRYVTANKNFVKLI